MKNIIYPAFFLIIFAGAVYYFWTTQGPKSFSNTTVSMAKPDDVSKYFGTKLSGMAATKLNQISVRTDANLLVITFPGLVEADFSGVNAEDGNYELRGGALAFVAAGRSPSTAQNTITESGYRTLLTNISTRLNMPASTNAEVDALIQKIEKK